MIEKVSVRAKLEQISEHWAPKIVGQVGDFQVKLVKFQGDFVWHSHEHEDEMFLVIEGSFTMALRDRLVELQAGEFIVIPRGVEHKPYAENEVSVMLFEPATTLNTGEETNERTRSAEWL